MSEHVPGPWIVDDMQAGREGEVWVIAPNVTDDYHRFVVCVGDLEGITGEDLCNADLIAAAPDLLAACDLALTAFRFMRDDHPDEYAIIQSTGLIDAWDALKAATKQARGDGK